MELIFFTAKESANRVKRLITEWEKVFVICKGLLRKIYKELKILTARKQTTQLKKMG